MNIDPAREHHGFSLIELLIVVSITAVLAALLFPMSQRLFSSAQSANCLGNLRQIASAVATYTGENNGYVPPIQTDMRDANGNTVSTRWFIELNPYLKYKPITDFANLQKEGRPLGEPKSYLCPANRRIGNRGGAYVNYTGILNASGNTFVPYLGEARRHITSYKSPLSELPYVIDGYASDNYSYIHQHAVDLYVGITSAQSAVNQQEPAKGVYTPVHGNNINILYLDGHAATSEIRTFSTNSYNYARP